MCKSLETNSNNVWHDPELIATKVCTYFAAKSVAYECDVWRQCKSLQWVYKLQFSIKRFFEQSATQNKRLLSYRLTIHNLISKICPKFQVLNSYFSELDEVLDEHWQKRFAVMNSGISCLALIFNLSNPRMTMQKKRFKVAKYDIRTIWTHGLVIKASGSESGNMDSIHAGCWNSLQCLCQFAWNWACQCSDTCYFILLLCVIFFFSNFVSGNIALLLKRVLTLNIWTSEFHCFGALWKGPWALTQAHMQAWRMGSHNSCCRA